MERLSSAMDGSPEDALLRAARAALDWSIVRASRQARVSVAAILAAEGRRPRAATAADAEKLWASYREAGLRRLDDDDGRPGIILAPSRDPSGFGGGAR